MYHKQGLNSNTAVQVASVSLIVGDVLSVQSRVGAVQII